MDSLSLAREQFRQLSALGRAGVKTRMFRLMHDNPRLSADSIFVYAVAAEIRGDPLP